MIPTPTTPERTMTNLAITLTMPLEKFHWSPETGLLTAEESDFGAARDGRWWMVDIYEGLPFKGINIKSHVTGNIECFRWAENIYHGSGEDREFAGLKFRPINPDCKVKEVVIFND